LFVVCLIGIGIALWFRAKANKKAINENNEQSINLDAGNNYGVLPNTNPLSYGESSFATLE
jgi:hypothetical protein